MAAAPHTNDCQWNTDMTPVLGIVGASLPYPMVRSWMRSEQAVYTAR